MLDVIACRSKSGSRTDSTVLSMTGKYSVPSLLGEECAANPFLRADNPELAEAIGMKGENAVDVCAEIRRRKDIF